MNSPLGKLDVNKKLIACWQKKTIKLGLTAEERAAFDALCCAGEVSEKKLAAFYEKLSISKKKNFTNVEQLKEIYVPGYAFKSNCRNYIVAKVSPKTCWIHYMEGTNPVRTGWLSWNSVRQMHLKDQWQPLSPQEIEDLIDP